MATKSGMKPVHPGEVLREELDELGISANASSPVGRASLPYPVFSSAN